MEQGLVISFYPEPAAGIGRLPDLAGDAEAARDEVSTPSRSCPRRWRRSGDGVITCDEGRIEMMNPVAAKPIDRLDLERLSNVRSKGFYIVKRPAEGWSRVGGEGETVWCIGVSPTIRCWSAKMERVAHCR